MWVGEGGRSAFIILVCVWYSLPYQELVRRLVGCMQRGPPRAGASCHRFPPSPLHPRSSYGGKLVEDSCSTVSPGYGSLAPAVTGLIGNSSTFSKQVAVSGCGL